MGGAVRRHESLVGFGFGLRQRVLSIYQGVSQMLLLMTSLNMHVTRINITQYLRYTVFALLSNMKK